MNPHNIFVFPPTTDVDIDFDSGRRLSALTHMFSVLFSFISIASASPVLGTVVSMLVFAVLAAPATPRHHPTVRLCVPMDNEPPAAIRFLFRES